MPEKVNVLWVRTDGGGYFLYIDGKKAGNALDREVAILQVLTDLSGRVENLEREVGL